MTSPGELVLEHVLEPVSGKAVPVRRGEVLRLSLVEGAQCIDFNCFSLHDYKEHLSQSWTRLLDPSPSVGSVLISRPPRYRPMMAILSMADSCVIDMVGPGCHGAIWELRYGLDRHPNCQDTLAESIREFGLTPDDVHDSYNFWYQTAMVDGLWNPDGGRLRASAGDYVELIALIDVLAVPAVCGAAALNAGTGNFWPKRVGIEVYAASEETAELVSGYERHMGRLRSQSGPESFRTMEVRSERRLEPTAGYEAAFLDFPLQISEIVVSLDDTELAFVDSLRRDGLGETSGDVLRSVVMQWYNDTWANIPAPGRTYRFGADEQ